MDSGTGGVQAMTVATAADVAYVLIEGQAGTSTLAKVTGVLIQQSIPLT